MNDDEIVPPSFQEMVARPKLSPDQLRDAVGYLSLSRLALNRIYTFIQESDRRMMAPGGEDGTMFDDYHRRVVEAPAFPPAALLDGMHVPVKQHEPPKEAGKKRWLLPGGRNRTALPAGPEIVQGELMHFISPQQVQERARDAAESGAILSDAMITNLLDNYDYHLSRWRKKFRHDESNHPAQLIKTLLTVHMELNGTPDESLIRAIAEKTGTELAVWEQLVRNRQADNAMRLNADGLLDFLESDALRQQPGGPKKT